MRRPLLALAALLALVSFWASVTREAPGERKAEATSALDPVAALQVRTAGNPQDSAAWQALGEAHFAAGDFVKAIAAFEKAARLAPGKAMLWSSLGEARVMVSTTNPLPDTALADFRRAIAADPEDPRARYFLAVKKDLDGDHEGAIAAWLDLARDSPPGAPWREDLVRTIEQVGKINRIDVSKRIASALGPDAVGGQERPVSPGPTAQDLAAAAAIPPGEQRQMARGMVARLEARLKANPRNPNGWLMLIRSRLTLGEREKALAALRDALAANPAEAASLRTAAGQLGLE